MSNEEFENYLALVSRLLRLSATQRDQIGEELRDHMESRVSELVELGVEKKAAVLQSVEEFGDAAVLAENLKRVSVRNRKRWVMRFATLCTLGAFLAAVLTMAMWPEDARFGSPSNLAAQTQANQKIRELLKQKCSLQYEELPYFEVQEELAEKLGLNFVLTDSAQEDSLVFDQPVTVNLQGLPYASALRIMLAKHNATYCIRDQTLFVISLDDASCDERYFARKMIDVSKLLTQIRMREFKRIGQPVSTSAIKVNGPESGNGSGATTGPRGGGVFCLQEESSPQGQKSGDTISKSDIQKLTNAIEKLQQASEKPAPVAKLITAESMLLEAIQTAVHLDEWRGDSTNGEWRMTCVGDVLIVIAPDSAVEQVEDFLTDFQYMLEAPGSWSPADASEKPE